MRNKLIITVVGAALLLAGYSKRGRRMAELTERSQRSFRRNGADKAKRGRRMAELTERSQRSFRRNGADKAKRGNIFLRMSSVAAVVAASVILSTSCSKDDGPQGGTQPDGKIGTISVTSGGFTTLDGLRSSETGQNAAANSATVTMEDAGTVYTRAAIGSQVPGADGSGHPATRATDEGYASTFNKGDMIGLTVVRDGALLHNNLKLTFNGTEWQPPSIDELWYYQRATYIAYYPYDVEMNEVINGATDRSEEAIKASIFAAFTPQTNQSTYANYTASDFMMWSGYASGTYLSPTLNISLEHAMALVIVEPRGAGYLAPAGAEWVYYEGLEYSAPSDVTVSIGGADYTPYVMLDTGNSTATGTIPGAGDGTYRVLVKPAAATAIAGEYETMGVTVVWDNAEATTKDLTKGKYIKYNVNPPAMPFTGTSSPFRGAAVGDFFYLADGVTYPNHRILPSDLMTTETKAGCSGIVFWIDTADAAKGKIVSLDEEGSLKWADDDNNNILTGVDDISDGLENMHAMSSIFANDPTKSWSNFPAFEWVDLRNGMSGKTTYASGMKGVWYLPAKEELKALYAGFSGKVYENITGWRDSSVMPGQDDPNAINARKTFNLALTGLGGTPLASNWYWSSTEANFERAWVVGFGDGYVVGGIRNLDCRVRAVLAF